jgi:pyridoxamine 5'-phosphate oxidase family protein
VQWTSGVLPAPPRLDTEDTDDMTFNDDEISYLASQRLGRLATVQADGTPQVNPVGFRYNPELESIDIGGYTMSTSQKYRNVRRDPRVAFVVDDVVSTDPWRVRCLEIRGMAEAVPDPSDPVAGSDTSLIRIRPHRIIGFGLDRSDLDPHLVVPHKRDID